MGKCCNNINRINEYLDKQIDLKKKGLSYFDAELERHADECDVCRQELREQQKVFSTLAEIKEFEPPEDFTNLLMTKLPKMTRHSLSNWTLLLGVIAMTSSTSILSLIIYRFVIETGKLSFIKTIFSSLIIKGLDLVQDLLASVYDIFGLFFNILKAFLTLLEKYPLPFTMMFLFTVVISIILFSLVNSFQRENYA